MQIATRFGRPIFQTKIVRKASPRIDELFDRLHRVDRRFNAGLVFFWTCGLLFAAFAYSQGQITSCWFTLAITTGIVVIGKLGNLFLGRLAFLKKELKAFKKQPSSDLASSISNQLMAKFLDRPSVNIIVSAVKWTAAWCELSQNETDALITLSKSCTKLADFTLFQLMRGNRFASAFVIKAALAVAKDALALATTRTLTPVQKEQLNVVGELLAMVESRAATAQIDQFGE